jgi:hypothetical protein
VSPYKFGEANAKFRVMPDPGNCPVYTLPPQNHNLPNFLRSALSQQLSTDRVPACFVLQIQRQDANKYMPIEDTSIEWREQDAAFRKRGADHPAPSGFRYPGAESAMRQPVVQSVVRHRGASPDWRHQSLAQSGV